MNIPDNVYTKLAKIDKRLEALEVQLEYARSIDDQDKIDILQHEFFNIILEKLGVDNA
jgi:hypothetical protein